MPLGFAFPYQGQNWTSVFVNSNGNLTFGAASTDFSETVPEFLAGPPRIAPLWDDLDASDGCRDRRAGPRGRRRPLRQRAGVLLRLAQLLLGRSCCRSACSTLDYAATARSDAIVGVTEGNGATDPGEQDLSDDFPILSGRGTLYERFLFPDPGDLSFVDLLFLPI